MTGILQAGHDGDGRLVIVYERVSSDRQDITRQAIQRDRAKADHPDCELVPIQDDGVSAFKVSIFDRDGGRRLCELVESGKVAAIYTDAQDRLSRGDDVEWVTFRALCESNGTRLVIDGVEQRNDLGGRLEGYLKAILARQESVEKSHRVQSGKAASARAGRRNGGPRPYGYVQAGGVLSVVPDEAAVLRLIRDKVLAGWSLSNIARELTRRGVKTVRGVAWTQTRISQILSNPLYTGQVTYKAETFDGNHEAVFLDAEWRELQAILASRRRNKSGSGGRTPKRHLFAGQMLRCAHCGGSMVPRTTRNTQGRQYETYRCIGQLQGSSPDCKQPTVRREALDGAVLRYFEGVGLDVDETRRKLAEQSERALAETSTILSAAEREMALAEDRLARVKADYRDGKIDADEWREHKAELEAERSAATESVRRLREQRERISSEGAAVDAADEMLGYLSELRAAVAGRVRGAGSIESVRAGLIRLFDGFTVHALDPELARDEPAPLPEGWVRSNFYVHPDLLVPGDERRTGLLIEPHPRAAAILDHDQETAFPELHRVALERGVFANASRR